MSENIGYHTRLYEDNTVKVIGGSFGGDLSIETANRLIHAHKFTVVVKPSGTPVFVDREGREVRLYLSVDVAKTEKGAATMKEWYAERYRKEEEARKREADEQEEIQDLMSTMTHEEIVSRLKGEK